MHLPAFGKKALFRTVICCKTFWMMKTFLIFFATACLQLSAKTYSQVITLSVKNAKLETVFKEIQRQTTYSFVYTREEMDVANKVTLYVKQADLETVLDLCLRDQPLTYLIEDKFVIISLKERQRTIDGNAQQDLPDISGKVINEDGEPLAGVTILVKGTNKAAATNEAGEFLIKEVSPDASLVISSVGYFTQEYLLQGRLKIHVQLRKAINSLDETIVVAYGTTTRRLNTGSISKLRAEDISKQPVSNPIAATQGRISGLYIIQRTGAPGSGFTVRLRGQNSIANGNDPLYIIDGVPFTSSPIGSTSINTAIIVGGNPLNSINPTDIEGIEVLKDADATAIYGSRGANGVILITTKKGKAGKTKLDLSVYAGLSKVSNTMDLLNTAQYLGMRRQAFINDAVPMGPNNAYDFLQWDTTKYTDWQKELIGGTAEVVDAQAAVSGGSSSTQFRFGGGYHKEGTVFPGDFDYHKGSGHFSLNHLSQNKKFRAVLSTNYSLEKNNLIGRDLTSIAITLAPNVPDLINEEGELQWPRGIFFNPYSLLLREYKSDNENFISNALLSYNIVDALKIKANLGYTQLEVNEISTSPIAANNPAFGINTGSTFFSENSIKTWIAEPQLEYQHTLAGGIINILAGTTFQQSVTEGQMLFATGFTHDALLENIAAASDISVENANYAKYRYNAIFGRLNYDWKSKYLINITGRRDGSSRFGPHKQFANFGAIGAAWVFTKEKFFDKSSSVLSFGKLRGSYGVTGNDQIGDYMYLDTYSSSFSPYLGVNGLFPSRLYNPDFAWETNKKIEAAIELGLYKDRIQIITNYYRNRSNNLLVGYPLPLITGGASIQGNLPAKVENSGWEFEINADVIRHASFRWTVVGNLSIPRNKLIEYPNIEGSAYANTYEVGKSLFTKKKLHYLGVDPKTGIYSFEDINGDRAASSPQDLQPMKTVAQDYHGGIQNVVSFKGFEVDVFFQFVKQTGANYLADGFVVPGRIGNQPTIVQNSWKNPGDNVSVQRYTVSFGDAYEAYDKSQSYGDNIYGDASFIRLKNLSLSYQLDAKTVEKLKISAAKFFIQGRNLLTITDYQGLDPENQTNRSLPPLRTLTAGFQIIF